MSEKIRIDQLPPTILPSNEHEFAAIKDGLTVKLTVGQILDIVKAEILGNVTDSYDTLEEVLQAVQDISLTGLLAFFPLPNSPAGWIKANGATISRETYSALFAKIGTTFGSGDGSTTFQLPDVRAEFPRFLDDGRGVDASRALGSVQGDAIREMTGQYRSGQHGAYDVASGVFSSVDSTHRTYSSGVNSGALLNFAASNQVPTASENRPRNIAFLGCIKY